MTALGKTLVFFNLLFALITGWMMTVVYVTRTNWKKGQDEAVAETKSAFAMLRQEQDAAKQRKSEFEAAVQKLNSAIEAEKRLVAEQTARAGNEEKKRQDAEANSAKYLAASQGSTTEIVRLQRERNQMYEQLKVLNETIAKVNKDNADLTTKETYSRLRADSLERERSDLQERFNTASARLEELRARVGPSVAGAQPNPPRAPSISTAGKVTGVADTLASFSLGSDNGLVVGHILQVYRTNEYLGTLTVSRLEPHAGVGAFEPAGRGKKVKIGDSVDTKIIR